MKKSKDPFKDLKNNPVHRKMTRIQNKLYAKFLEDRGCLNEKTAFIFALLDYSDYLDKQKK
jgi:hypothetical protein